RSGEPVEAEHHESVDRKVFAFGSFTHGFGRLEKDSISPDDRCGLPHAREVGLPFDVLSLAPLQRWIALRHHAGPIWTTPRGPLRSRGFRLRIKRYRQE